jgi:pimeloyl-ACP methyl ester carboxylesterase
VAFSRGFSGFSSAIRGDGVELMVARSGAEDKPPIVFVHGYPDTHAVWLPTIARLVDDFRCIAYDVRGAGESSAPSSTEGYRVEHLVSDLVCVLDTLYPQRRVHLVGHDWGSVQAWEAVLTAGSDPRLTGRIASYTSISGPSLGHFGAWARRARRGNLRQRRDLARQLAHSWYLAAFQVPWAPELALRGMLRSPGSARRLLGLRHPAETVSRDAVNGLGLYRANLRHHAHGRHPLHTDIPVQLIVPLRDRYLTPAVYADLPRYCSDLTRHDIDAGHWVQQSHPDEVARLVGEFVSAHERGAGDSSA